jgi:tRNA(fMet)-specific endonuclease VapC
MKYLIDTNICIYIINHYPAKVVDKFKQFELGDIGISTISVSELQYGVSKSAHRERNQLRLQEFLTPLEICAYDATAALVYGDIRQNLESSGKLIGPLDMLIAAHALGHDWTLITNNENEFKRVEGLKVENWVMGT